jgi:hypothetical protein
VRDAPVHRLASYDRTTVNHHHDAVTLAGFIMLIDHANAFRCFVSKTLIPSIISFGAAAMAQEMIRINAAVSTNNNIECIPESDQDGYCDSADDCSDDNDYDDDYDDDDVSALDRVDDYTENTTTRINDLAMCDYVEAARVWITKYPPGDGECNIDHYDRYCRSVLHTVSIHTFRTLMMRAGWQMQNIRSTFVWK